MSETRADHLSAIQQKCIEALEGFEIEDNAVGRTILKCYRPIRLADVLLAIAMSYENWHREELGCAVEINQNDPHLHMSTNETGYCNWNLRTDDITLQDDPTVAFIHSLLCV